MDLTLRAGADKLLRPVASVADVAFSGGGDGPLVSLKRGGKSLLLSWPGRLPSPVVSGDSATYPAVLPDVDLVVRATHTGFTHVLVVKTAQAAAEPAVRTLSLGVGGDARVERMPNGSLRAVAGSTLVAQAEPAVMWDSSLPAGGTAAAGQDSNVAESTAFAAGDGARTAAVASRLTGDGDLELVPDVKLLDAADVTFPVFVDPAWSVAKSKWAYATNTGCTNTDYSVARVGLSPEGPCPGDVFRSFFEFPMTNGTVSIKGKHIESAYVQMKLYHSWSCGNTTANMYLTPAINATMKASWSAMTLSKWLDSASGHANKGSGCSDSPQPDMIMNFTGSTVTSQVQTAATSWPGITVGFSARDSDGTDESTQDRWKKFYPANAKLIVDYDSKPGKPTGLQIAGVACPSGGVGIGTLTPTFSAVYPDADSGQTLTGTYEWIEVPATGMGAVTATYPTRKTPPPTAPATANGRATTAAVSGLVLGKTYAYRVTAVDPAPYSQWSGWSDWCQFWPDTTVPPAPTVTPGTIPGPGKPITFTFTTTSTDVVKFRYGWSSPPVTEITATGTGTKTATVTLTVPKYGKNIVWVRGIDAVGNLGNIGSREITVGRPSPPVARWGLETYPGQTQPQALADAQPALGDTDGTGPLLNDTALTASLSRWSSAELAGQAVAEGLAVTVSASTVRRWLAEDAIRPWLHRSWIFPRGPHFAVKAARVLDLYQRVWEGVLLGEDEYVVSADEKSQLQALSRCYPSLSAAPGRAARVEFEYDRHGTLAYFGAYDVHRARLMGRVEPTTGIAPFGRLVRQVMTSEPYASANRVFGVVDNGSSHAGKTSIARMRQAWPTATLVHLPVHASWLNQIEVVFSVIQRKVIKPVDFADLDAHRGQQIPASAA